jgi:hypothetical protein
LRPRARAEESPVIDLPRISSETGEHRENPECRCATILAADTRGPLRADRTDWVSLGMPGIGAIHPSNPSRPSACCCEGFRMPPHSQSNSGH